MTPIRVHHSNISQNRSLLYLKQQFICIAVIAFLCFFYTTSVNAQVTSPATINNGNPTGVNFLGGTTTNTQNFGSLSGLGLNQGESFTFSGQPDGIALWNGGFQFLNTQILQFQADRSGLPANPVDYEIDFTDVVYGLQFSMGGLDNRDETIVTFYRNNVPVAVSVSTYVNGAVTVTNPNNIISFAGTNIDIDPSGNGFRVDGDGNNDAGSVGSIHGAQEEFSVSLPLELGVDEVRLSSTGKNNGSGGNVTLILRNFAWARPNIAVTKLDSFSQGGNGESNIGDDITYTYTVTNNGNVPISDVALSETGFTGTGTTPVPVFTSGTGGATPTNLPTGETLTYSITYPVTASDLLTGFVDNQATVTGLPGDDVAGQEISDLSDSENTGDGGAQGSLTEDDSNRTDFPTPIVFNPSIEAVKTADETGLSSPSIVGNNIIYTITIFNNGDVDLSGITLTDTLTNAIGGASSPTPSFVSSSAGSPAGSLVVSETATYQFTYAITQADIDSGSISNSVRADANAFTGGTVFDVSDDDNDADGNTTDDPTLTTLNTNPSITVTKVANNTVNVPAGVTVTYSYRVTNNGNQTISNISLSDAHLGTGTPPVPNNETLDVDAGTTGDSTDITSNDGVWSTLAPGDTVLFTANYVVTQQDIDTLQ